MEHKIKGQLLILDEQWEASSAFSQRMRELVRERRRLVAQGREDEALSLSQILDKLRDELGKIYPEFIYGLPPGELPNS